ncbi:hypothetical protein [Thalassotalea sp. ND16A]|uniref:hypothetical protein n=1 Tax=Thalassotalea sp. ND16A TaxID=1535422 RepID=UPI00051A0A5A|nr:hypothetical protein [Thalassotalea sp. ND16A]KGK01645.1 hypothetical protein ND16A_2929 [Thalassotalea sp. ND16A]
MQRIIEFKKKTFWSSQIDINALNNKIAALNKDGWFVKSIIPNLSLFGGIYSYTVLIELAK